MREAEKAKSRRMHGKRKAGLMDAKVATSLRAECQRTRPRQDDICTYVLSKPSKKVGFAQ